MASTNNLSVVIDLGTSKIVALAGCLNENGAMEILGMEIVPSKGIKRGVVFNVDEAADAVNSVLEKLEEQFEEEVECVHVAFAGQNMQTLDYKTSTTTTGEGVVAQQDVERLLDNARNVELSDGYKVIRVIPTSYVIDDDVEVEKPVGTTGVKIEANFKLSVISASYLNSLKLVFDRLGIELGEIIDSSLAITEAVTTSEEKELGVAVLDFGAGTTNVAVYQNNVLLHTAVVPFGGQVVTNDIKEGCSISLKKAELMKTKYGEAMGDFADESKVVTIAGENGWEPRQVSFKSLAYIIQARLEEIIECVYAQIEKSGVDAGLSTGIIITGGASALRNMVSLVKFKTCMDARRAKTVIYPVNHKEELKKSEYLTALGAMKLVLAVPDKTEKRAGSRTPKNKARFAPLFKGVVQGALNLFDVDNNDLELN